MPGMRCSTKKISERTVSFAGFGAHSLILTCFFALLTGTVQIEHASAEPWSDSPQRFGRGPIFEFSGEPPLSALAASTSTSVVAQVSTDDSQSLRGLYELALETIDTALAGWETNRSIVPGFDQSIDLILLSRRKAVEAYFDADYSEAVRLASQALAEIDRVSQQEEDYYNLNMNIALQAYQEEDYQRGKNAISLAIALRPDSEEAQFWQRRINQLPELISIKQEIITAQNTGRLQDEINALYRLLAIKPDDEQTLVRIAEANRQLQNRKFNQAIGTGHRALADRDLAKAKQALSRVQKIKPTHSETERLRQDIAAVALDMQIAQLMTSAEQSAAADDWYNAVRQYDSILALSPQQSNAIQGREFAGQMVVAQRNLDDFLARPHRLNSADIAAAALKEIERVRPVLDLSPHMQETVTALELELKKWQTEVPLRVISDGETHISVRGVGIIGTVTDRTVLLRPGTYKLEGKKKGYRNKLIEVLVSSDANVLNEVKIICDEPI